MQRKALPEILGGFFIFYLDMSKGLGYFKGKGNVAQTKELPMKKIRNNLCKAYALLELIFSLGFLSFAGLVVYIIFDSIFYLLAKIW